MSANDVKPGPSESSLKNNDQPIALPEFFLELGVEAIDFLNYLDRSESLWRTKHREEAEQFDLALMDMGLRCLCRSSKILREWRVEAYMGFPFIFSLTWNLCLASAKKEQATFLNWGYDDVFFEIKEVLSRADHSVVDLFEDLRWLQKRVLRHYFKLA